MCWIRLVVDGVKKGTIFRENYVRKSVQRPWPVLLMYLWAGVHGTFPVEAIFHVDWSVVKCTVTQSQPEAH